MIRWLELYPDLELVGIEGHADAREGRDAERLALERAEVVKRYFIAHGVAQIRQATRGVGDSVPTSSARRSSWEGRSDAVREEPLLRLPANAQSSISPFRMPNA